MLFAKAFNIMLVGYSCLTKPFRLKKYNFNYVIVVGFISFMCAVFSNLPFSEKPRNALNPTEATPNYILLKYVVISLFL